MRDCDRLGFATDYGLTSEENQVELLSVSEGKREEVSEEERETWVRRNAYFFDEFGCAYEPSNNVSFAVREVVN